MCDQHPCCIPHLGRFFHDLTDLKLYKYVFSFCCSCVAGYIGERCQFSDLEWWDLQQAEEEKKKNVLIAACVVMLVSLLSIAACITYCYR